MIKIIDYGLGNIKAFANIYKKLNIECSYARTEKELRAASKIILPGVGAFDYAMKQLNSSGLRDALDELVLHNKVPVIGICVGMQMMADSSEEGRSKGLGWISGKIRRFSRLEVSSMPYYPLPHMGWNSLELTRRHLLLSGLDEDKRFYYLHSYFFDVEVATDILATARYGILFPSIIHRENIYGIQCHPEKSHHNGVALLKNFGSL